MILKKHNSPQGIVLALCDKNILGKKFETEDFQLDLSSNFYQGEEKTEEEIKTEIKKAYIINICGEKSINFAKKENLVSNSQIKIIQQIPYAQIIIIRD